MVPHNCLYVLHRYIVRTLFSTRNPVGGPAVFTIDLSVGGGDDGAYRSTAVFRRRKLSYIRINTCDLAFEM